MYKILVRKPQGKKQVWRPRIYEMDIGEVGCEDVDQIQVAGLGPVAGCCEHSDDYLCLL
jgi:hypothetical protein